MTEQVLRVDPIACRAHGLCAEELPGVIVLDEWGYPMLPSGPVSAHLRRRADDRIGMRIMQCPPSLWGNCMYGVRRDRKAELSSPGWTRTNNRPINSRMLCQLSYGGPAPSHGGGARPE